MRNNYTFFNKNSILGNKLFDYRDWHLAAKFMSTKSHLTQEGLDSIFKLKQGMNKGR